MSHIGDSLPAAVPSEVLPPPGTEIEVADQPTFRNQHDDEVKSDLVIRTLLSAGLKRPFDFSVEDAVELWGSKLGGYDTDVLLEAIQEWVDNPGTDFPTVAEVDTQARYVVRQRASEARAKSANQQARATGPCPECAIVIDFDEHEVPTVWDNVHWYKIQVEPPYPGGPDHVMRPCPRCLPEMSALWDTGHFTKEHKNSGACSACRHYHWPWKYKDPRLAKGRIG